MDFSYDDEQRAVRELATGLAGKFDDTYWQGIDEEHRFPEEFWSVLVDHELLGIAVAEEYGGSGKGLLDMVILAEALAEGGAGMEGGALLVSGPVFGGCLISRHGTKEQRETYLPAMTTGDLWAGAFTEPDAGSNITMIRTEATRSNDHYVINGQKTFISLMKRASRVVVLARTTPYDPERRTKGVSLLLGDLPSSAVEIQPFNKMGTHYMDTSAVYFTDYEVPAENLVGEEGNVWPVLYDVLNPERIVIAAVAVGTGFLAIKKAVEYAEQRSVWGKPISTHQGVQFPLTKAMVELSAARLKVYEAAWLYDRGTDCGVSAASAKYSASHAALDAADSAMQTLGGAGYMTESGMERHWRNLRLNRIGPVSDEMTLNYLAQHALGMPRSY
ncbi:MAG: acyl-CoA dehydrogenase family protein [Solirubrobacterales bacterium]